LSPFPSNSDKLLNSHLLGHESEGSILSFLKSQGWANGLASSCEKLFLGVTECGISIDLTDAGVGHVDEIVANVFSYIHIATSSGAAEWIMEEVKSESDLKFRFLNKIDPIDYVVRISESMHVHDKKHVLSGSYLIFETDLALVNQTFQYLTPANCCIFVKHKGFTGSTKFSEPWYGTLYNNERAPELTRALWRQAHLNPDIAASMVKESGSPPAFGRFALPSPNPFTASDFSLRCETAPSTSGKQAPSSGEEGGIVTRLLVPSLIVKDLIEALESVADSSPTEPAPQDDAVRAAAESAEDGVESAGAGSDDEEAEVDLPAITVPDGNGTQVLTWFLQDNFWKVPKGTVIVRLESCVAYSSPENAIYTELYCNILKELLSEFSYYADCAGLHYSVNATMVGMDLNFYGYNHKLNILVDKAIQTLRKMAGVDNSKENEACSIELFERMKEKLVRSYYNFIFSQPYVHCSTATMLCLEEPRWSQMDKYRAAKHTSLQLFSAFCRQFLQIVKLEILVHGNLSNDEATSITNAVKLGLACKPLPESLEVIRRVVSLQPGKFFVSSIRLI
jgi:secreted Zn-dependent insulinase-like peptidase